jgi:hypothetical protein
MVQFTLRVVRLRLLSCFKFLVGLVFINLVLCINLFRWVHVEVLSCRSLAPIR